MPRNPEEAIRIESEIEILLITMIAAYLKRCNHGA